MKMKNALVILISSLSLMACSTMPSDKQTQNNSLNSEPNSNATIRLMAAIRVKLLAITRILNFPS